MPPTRAGIAKELGFRSTNAAEEHLKALAGKGALKLIAGAFRGIHLLVNHDVVNNKEGLPLIDYAITRELLLTHEHVEYIL